MKQNRYFLFYLLCCNSILFAQKNDCDEITSFLNQKEKQIEHLNLHDPDYIPLHYFIAKDIIKELEQFRNDVIPYFTACKTITFSELIDKYDVLKNNMQTKYDSLSWLNNNVYLIFYEKALYEYQINNEVDGEYFLQRSLQYNDIFPNAILLKLNKLLDKNNFEACLSLLNTLYYETQMDRAQEMQAIDFTGKFYDKLYKTGDSLVKIDHAAEALKLFEILEIFCLNLPTSYCNDDYYHGVLRSKSGIYESYLAIAKVADQRGNARISDKFYQYAQEYLEGNSYLKNYEHREEALIENNNPVIEQIEPLPEENLVIITHEAEKVAIEAEKATITTEKAVTTEENNEPKPTPKEIKEKYEYMILQALALCIKEDFSASYKMFLEAKKLEDCHCFDTDFRVDLMLRELSKITH